MKDRWDKRLLELSDDAFESLCFDLVLAQGYLDAKRVGGPGDRGRDIQAKYLHTEPDKISVTLEKCHFECKRIGRNLGIDEIFPKIHWAETNKVDVLVLMCNNRLTSEANEYIEKHNLDKKRPRILDWTGDRFKLILFNSSSVFSQFFLGEEIPPHYLSKIQDENNKKILSLLPKTEIKINVKDILNDRKREELELQLKQAPLVTKQLSTIYGVIGTTLLLHKKYKESVEYFKKCSVLDPKNVSFMINHSFSLVKINKYNKAEEILEAILKLDPNNSHALNGIGHLLVERGKYKPAIYRFDLAIDVNPEFTICSDNKAVALFELGKIVESIDLLNEVLSKKKNMNTLKTKTSLLTRLYVLNEALFVSNAAQQEFENFEILNQKGHILERMGKLEESKTTFENALSYDPKNSLGIANLAVCQGNLGNREKAFSLIDEAIANEPYNAFTWRTKSLLLLRNGDLKSAKKCNAEARKHISNSDQKKRIHLLEAQIASGLGNPKKAMREAMASLKIDVRFLEAWNFIIATFPNEKRRNGLKRDAARSFFEDTAKELGEKMRYVGG